MGCLPTRTSGVEPGGAECGGGGAVRSAAGWSSWRKSWSRILYTSAICDTPAEDGPKLSCNRLVEMEMLEWKQVWHAQMLGLPSCLHKLCSSTQFVSVGQVNAKTGDPEPT